MVSFSFIENVSYWCLRTTSAWGDVNCFMAEVKLVKSQLNRDVWTVRLLRKSCALTKSYSFMPSGKCSIQQFRSVINLFEEFKILYTKMICLDKVIRKKFKFKKFWRYSNEENRTILNTIKNIRILKFHSFSLYSHFTNTKVMSSWANLW